MHRIKSNQWSGAQHNCIEYCTLSSSELSCELTILCEPLQSNSFFDEPVVAVALRWVETRRLDCTLKSFCSSNFWSTCRAIMNHKAIHDHHLFQTQTLQIRHAPHRMPNPLASSRSWLVLRTDEDWFQAQALFYSRCADEIGTACMLLRMLHRDGFPQLNDDLNKVQVLHDQDERQHIVGAIS